MNKNNVNQERVVSIIGFLFLVIAAITGFLFDGDPDCILEKFADTSIIIPYTHVFCGVLTFYTIFKPNDKILIFVMTIESMLLILTDLIWLGVFFFYATVILIFCKDLFKKQNKKILLILTILHIIALLGSYTHGWKFTLIAMGYSIFSFAFYLWIYKILKAKLSCFIPSKVTNNQTIQNKKPGDVISLSQYNLTERQISFVLENLHNNLSYKDISDKYYVSISTVKKTFAEVFKIFDVTKLEELRILLLQYQIQQ